MRVGGLDVLVQLELLYVDERPRVNFVDFCWVGNQLHLAESQLRFDQYGQLLHITGIAIIHMICLVYNSDVSPSPWP